MANCFAKKPPVVGADPKMALEGTIMFRRSEVMGALTKAIFYARRNLTKAREEGREDDVEIQRVRLRAFDLVKDALHSLPEFENPAPTMAIERVCQPLKETV